MSRLEDIIQESKIEGTKDETPFYFREVDEVDFRWLIKQAKRVEELEEENEALAETRRLDAVENVRLWEENQRYKQALEEIAQDTGTPYADIAIKALAGDNS